jgi:hypothetical protein
VKHDVCVTAILVTILSVAIGVSSQQVSSANARHQKYRVVILPPDGGPDSFLAGYLSFAPLTDRGTLGVAADTTTPGAPPFNSLHLDEWQAGGFPAFAAAPGLDRHEHLY